MSGTTLLQVLPGQSPELGAQHFRRTLDAITLTRPRFNTDTWTATQAAQFWVEGYDPDDTNALPPYLVLGVVARLAMIKWFYHPILEGPAKHIRTDACTIPMGRGVFDGKRGVGLGRFEPPHYDAEFTDPVLGRNRIVRTLEMLYRPVSDIDGRPTGTASVITSIIPGHSHYCNRSTCEDRTGWLGGCIRESDFQLACSRNLLVPWASVNWGGLACLLPPLRNCLVTPGISIRRARSHVTKPMVPIWVADAINTLHRIIPPALIELRRDAVFLQDLKCLLNGVSTERLRYWGLRASSPDSPLFMRHWDHCFTASCWSLGRRDMVYDDRDAAFYGLTTPVYDMLCNSQDPQMFGV